MTVWVYLRDGGDPALRQLLDQFAQDPIIRGNRANKLKTAATAMIDIDTWYEFFKNCLDGFRDRLRARW